MGAERDLFALRKDGTEVPVEIGLSPIERAEGSMVLAAIVDISQRKQAEAHRELLVTELNHRIKNILAVVQGIAHQTFRDDPASSDKTKAFGDRLIALARAHELLTDANWQNALLEDLAADTLYAGGANKQRVVLAGPPVLLPPRQAVALGMALHELFTNAVKYGALSNDTGKIELEWTHASDSEPLLLIVWRERGGPPVSTPKRRGFGSTLLERTLALDVAGDVKVEYRPEGLVCMITARLHQNESRRA